VSEVDEIIRRTKMMVILLQGPSKNYERQLAYWRRCFLLINMEG